jgi:dextranase
VLFDAEGNPISLAELFYIMDIAPESPWNAMIVEEFAETVRTLHFDGIHLDQYGFPKGEVRNGVGTTRDLEDDFPPLIDRSRAAVRAEKSDAGVIFNAVGNWPIERVAPTSQDAIYIEVWPPDVDDNDLRRLIREAKALGRGQQVILAAYLTPFLEQPQAPESEAAALLATAAIASVGGFHLLLGERNGILCDPYYPKFGTLREAFVPRLRAFYDHLVRFQEWMTADGVKDWEVELDGEGVAPAATVGAVWAIARSTADARIVHLVDLRDQTATEWNAPRTPWAGGKPPVRLSLSIDEPVREVLLISPDLPAGSPISIPHDPSAASVTVEFEMPGPWASVVVRV